VDPRVEWSYTETTVAMMSEASSQRALRLGQHLCDLAFKTRTHGKKRQDGLEFQSSGPPKMRHGGDSSFWVTLTAVRSHLRR